MQPSKRRPSPGTVFGLLALAIAVTGTAIAGPLATTSVLNKKEKRQVTRIAGAQVNKLAPGLAVARAGTAATATTATTAGNAGNADLLDGQDANDFTAADEVNNSGRAVVNDAVAGDLTPELTNLVVAGAFTIQSICAQDFGGGAGDVANLTIIGPTGSSFSGSGPVGVSNFQTPSASAQLIVLAEASTNVVNSSHSIAVAPNGDVVSVSASAEVNDPAGHCVFGVAAIGP